MTKKDYELIQETIRLEFKAFKELEIHPSHWQRLLSSQLANALESDNPKFNRAKFLQACGIETERKLYKGTQFESDED